MVLGVMVILVGFAINTPSLTAARYARPTKLAGAVIFLLGLVFSSITQIDAGQIGVQKLFGNVRSETLSSGLHFINPLVDVTMMDIKTQSYTMSATFDEGEKKGDDAIRVLSRDGLELIIDLTVLYKVSANDAPRIYAEIGSNYNEKIVRPFARTSIRDNAVYYDAVSLYSTKRLEFQQRIEKDIDREFKKRGFLMESVLIRNILLPESVKKTIESKINAEQESQKMQFILAKETQEAERKRVEAQGIADYQRIISSGLTDKQLQYEAIKAQKELATSNNTKVVIMGGGKTLTPIMLDKN
jgi:regulator of protease activity HflC (stomatin/prohibitin superfamily)